MIKKTVILFWILTFLNACQNKTNNCCPITSGRIENPQTVRDFVANDAIFIEFLKRCECKLTK